MNNVNKKTVKLIVMSSLLSTNVVFADFKSDIITSCSQYQQGIDNREMNPCKLYIDGFIDSSLLSENAVAKPKAMIENSSAAQNDYLNRAYQSWGTRNGLHIDYQFCIPLEHNRKEVASQVAKSLDIKKLDNTPLKEVALAALIAKYPCKAQK